MATLLGDIASVAPFNQIENISVFISFITSFSGALGMGLIVFATLKQSSLSPDSQFILSLCVADLIWSVINSTYGLVLLIYGVNVGYSYYGCWLHNYFSVCLNAVSIWSLAGVALNRYYIVVHGCFLDDAGVKRRLRRIWLFCILNNLYPLTLRCSDTCIALQSSRVYCSCAFFNNSWQTLVVIAFFILNIAGIGTAITWAYFFMVLTYFRKKRSSNQPSSIPSKKEEIVIPVTVPLSEAAKPPSPPPIINYVFTKDELTILLKTVSVTASYFLLWSPFLLKIMIEAASGAAISPEADRFVVLLVDFQSIVNALLLFNLDNKIKNNVLDLFGIRDKARKKRMDRAIEKGRKEIEGERKAAGMAGPANVQVLRLNLAGTNTASLPSTFLQSVG